MRLLQFICSPVCADEGKHINLSRFHQHPYCITATTINHIDHSGRKACSKTFKQWANQQHSIFGRLEHHRIAHNQGPKKHSECFVERIVVRPHASCNSQRHSSDLAHDTLLFHKIG